MEADRYFQGFAKGEDDFDKGLDNRLWVQSQDEPFLQGYQDAWKSSVLRWVKNNEIGKRSESYQES